MSYYKADRIERKNRRKAIVITTLLYLGTFSFFIVKDEIDWKAYIPFLENIVKEDVGGDTNEVAISADVRP